MTNTELLSAALTNGLDDDGTTAAALDAIREESGCSLLAAVLEVARVWRAARDARDLTEASVHLAADSPIHHALTQAILMECHELPPGILATIVAVDGSDRPRATWSEVDLEAGTPALAAVTVGAQWVKREASRLMLEAQRDAFRPRRRRSG